MAEQANKRSTKRPRVNGTHRWTDPQTLNLLQMVVDEIKDHVESFEKPTAQSFYNKISGKSTLLHGIQWVPMKCKMRHLKTSFASAIAWKNNTGSGLIASGDEKSVAEYLQKICPYWDLLQQIFGQRKGVNPRVIYETSSPDCVAVDENLFENFEDYITVEMDSPENESNFEVVQNDANDTLEPTVHSQLDSSLSSNIAKKQTAKTNKSSPLCHLLEIQEKKLELEVKRLDLEKEKSRSEIELRKIDHKYKLNKMEMEKQERIESEERKLKIESEERIRKFELQLHFNATNYD